MGPLGVPELLAIGAFVLGPVVGVAIILGYVIGGRAKRLGYSSTLTYLRAAPRTDEERRDAADLALKGLVYCMLGLILSPLVFVGLVPLFFGGRKLLYAALGLGLVDDGETPRA